MARKTYQGVKNNKERTKNKLVNAVGIVLEQKGYTGLNISNIAKAAGVDRKLVSLYFGSVDNLIEIYIKGKDYWLTNSLDPSALLQQVEEIGSHAFLESLLFKQIEYFSQNKEMQKAVLWEISENSELMSHIAQSREKLSTLLFPLADSEFEGKDVDIRAISSILIAGIYYLTLHSETTDSTFCEINLKTEDGMKRIQDAIRKILDWSFDK